MQYPIHHVLKQRYHSFYIFIITVISCNFGWITGQAQSVNVPFNSDYYALIERYEILSGKLSPELSASVKPFTRKSIAHFATRYLRDSTIDKTRQDNASLNYLQTDQWEWIYKGDSISTSKKRFVIGGLYKKKSDLYHIKDSSLNLHINPVVHIGFYREQGRTGYINTRGIDIRGMINHRLGFYTFFTENQAVFPSYVSSAWMQRVEVVPSEGFWKSFGSRGGVDFFTAKGYLSFQALPSINIQAGYDRFFIGHGYRSLILSDFAPNYLFLKIHTQVWKLQYTNLFAQMQANVFGNTSGTFGGKLFPSKYMAFHQLTMRITPRIDVAVFETVLFNRDTIHPSFDIHYLNPIIFYRSVEQQLGSPDNAMLGLSVRAIAGKHISLYSQFILDEFLLKEVRAGNGWWSNKYAIQAGFKYIEAFHIPQLDLQCEFNMIRPYTYAHESNYTNMTHYRQPLAHPLGANLHELIVILRYQASSKWFATGKYIHTIQGLDENGLNWGGNILLDYRTYAQEYGNRIGQGLKTTTQYLDMTATYMLKHNLFLDIKFIYRTQKNILTDIKNQVFAMAFRWNIGQRLQEF